MAIILYDITILPLISGLRNLEAMLTKAEAFIEEKSIKTEVLAGYRLAIDMIPLTKQIQIVSDTAKGAGARLIGMQTPPHFEDNEDSLEALKLRVQKTLDFLTSLSITDFEGKQESEITVKLPRMTLTFTGIDYVTRFVLPNFYFHLTTAYNILRVAGVPLGKFDYLGPLDTNE